MILARGADVGGVAAASACEELDGDLRRTSIGSKASATWICGYNDRMQRYFLCFLLLCTSVFSQNVCDAALPAIEPRGATIFSPQQEGYLGDVVAEQMQRRLLVYRQPGLTAPIENIAARLAQHLPAGGYRFQFTLIEIPQANAFAIPGGRIFVSRRLIAFVRSEDELAGVLAHEMGHVIARQAAVDMSQVFKDVLKVTSVGDRADISRKFNQLLDTFARKPMSRAHEEDDQVVADRVSTGAVWRAGYDSQAFPQFLDRLTENKGATGNLFTDLFGVTRPESKRFREMLKEVNAIPAACRETRPKDGAEAFRDWQKKISELSPEDLITTAKDRTPTIRLNPKIRPDITNIKFSQDGRFLLAQDESGINVLRREPFEYLFRIPALGALPAIFHKDSNRVIFMSGASRIETWNIETRSREEMWEPAENERCSGSTILSPDGRFVACLTVSQVWLRDLKAHSEVAHHVFVGLATRNFIPASRAVFSPDGSAFLASSARGDCCSIWAFDLDKQQEISIGRPLNAALGRAFAFVGSNRIAAVHPYNQQESGIFSWPDGKLIEKVPIPNLPFESVTKGPVLVVGPLEQYARGAFSLEDKQIFQLSRKSALDRYDDFGAAERNTGEIALYPGRKTQPIATLQLPDAGIGRVRSAAHSPNLEWLAVSVGSRAGLWNLKNGQAVLTAPFDGGFVSLAGVWTATFEQTEPNPGKQGDKKVFVRKNIDLLRGTELSSKKLPDQDKKEAGITSFVAQYEMHWSPDTPQKGKNTLQVKDTLTDQMAWSRELDDFPAAYLGNAVVLRFGAQSKYMDTILKGSPDLKKRMEAMPRRQDTSLLEVLDLATGKPLGYVLIDNGGGSVVIQSVRVAGRVLFIEDNNNRTLAYSLDTGDRTGQQFGQVLAVDPARGLVAVRNQPGQVVIFDKSMQPVADFEYPRNVIYAGFDGEGKRLLAVTGAQEVFVENLP